MSNSRSRDEIRLAPDRASIWERLELWHKTAIMVVAGTTALFGAGMAFQQAKATIVLTTTQHAVDERQDDQIRAVQDDAGRLHITLDDLHDEVRGMRMDLRYFDPRMRGGGLPALADEPRPMAHPTPLSDPSMRFALPTPTPITPEATP